MKTDILQNMENNLIVGLHLYTEMESNTLIYFNETGDCLSDKKTNYNFIKMDIPLAEKWISTISHYLYNYRSKPYFKSLLEYKRLTLKRFCNSLTTQLKQKLFQITQSEICPICLDRQDIGKIASSYHNNHNKHWACSSCYRQHNQNGSKPCPICRQGFL